MRVAGTRGKRRVVSLLLVLLLAHLLLLLLLLLLLHRDSSSSPPTAAASGRTTTSSPLPHARIPGSPTVEGSPCVGVGGGRKWAWQPVYTVVIDAGATATRAHVFSFLRCCLDNTFMLQNEDYFHQDDSILHYVNASSQMRFLLVPLLRRARSVVPPEYLPHTPLLVRATPSLRLLPRPHATTLISTARRIVTESGFLVKRGHVTIMAGHDEAADLWLAANFLTGRLYQNESSPLATADLGGGTLQVTVPLSGPPDHIKKAIMNRRRMDREKNNQQAKGETRDQGEGQQDFIKNEYTNILKGQKGVSVSEERKTNRSREIKSRKDINRENGGRRVSVSLNRRLKNNLNNNSRHGRTRDQREPSVSVDIPSGVESGLEEHSESDTSFKSEDSDHIPKAFEEGDGLARSEPTDDPSETLQDSVLYVTAADSEFRTAPPKKNKTQRESDEEIETTSAMSSAEPLTSTTPPNNMTTSFPSRAGIRNRKRKGHTRRGNNRGKKTVRTKQPIESSNETILSENTFAFDVLSSGGHAIRANIRPRGRGGNSESKDKSETRKNGKKRGESSRETGRRRHQGRGDRRNEKQKRKGGRRRSQRGDDKKRERLSASKQSSTVILASILDVKKPDLQTPSATEEIVNRFPNKGKTGNLNPRTQMRKERKRKLKKPTRRKQRSKGRKSRGNDNRSEKNTGSHQEHYPIRQTSISPADRQQTAGGRISNPHEGDPGSDSNPLNVGRGSDADNQGSSEISPSISLETLSDSTKESRKDQVPRRPAEGLPIHGSIAINNNDTTMRGSHHSRGSNPDIPESLSSATREPNHRGNHANRQRRKFRRGKTSNSEIESPASETPRGRQGRRRKWMEGGKVSSSSPPDNVPKHGFIRLTLNDTGHEVDRHIVKNTPILGEGLPIESITRKGDDKERAIGGHVRLTERRSEDEDKELERRTLIKNDLDKQKQINLRKLAAGRETSQIVKSQVAFIETREDESNRQQHKEHNSKQRSVPLDNNDTINTSNNEQSPTTPSSGEILVLTDNDTSEPIYTTRRQTPIRARGGKNQSRSITRKDRRRQQKSPLQIGEVAAAAAAAAEAGAAETTQNVLSPPKDDSVQSPHRVRTPRRRYRQHRHRHLREERDKSILDRSTETSMRLKRNILHGPHTFSGSITESKLTTHIQTENYGRQLRDTPKFHLWSQTPWKSNFPEHFPVGDRQYPNIETGRRMLKESPSMSIVPKINSPFKHWINGYFNQIYENRNGRECSKRLTKELDENNRTKREIDETQKHQRRRQISINKPIIQKTGLKNIMDQRKQKYTTQTRTEGKRCGNSREEVTDATRNNITLFNISEGDLATRTNIFHLSKQHSYVKPTEDVRRDLRTRRELRNLFDAPNITYRCSHSQKYWLFASSVAMGIYPARVKVLQSGTILRLSSTIKDPSATTPSPPTATTPRHRSDIPPEEEYPELGVGYDAPDISEPDEPIPEGGTVPIPSPPPSAVPAWTTSPSASLRPTPPARITSKWMEDTLSKVKTVVDSILQAIGSREAMNDDGQATQIDVDIPRRRPTLGPPPSRRPPASPARRRPGRRGSRRRKDGRKGRGKVNETQPRETSDGDSRTRNTHGTSEEGERRNENPNNRLGVVKGRTNMGDGNEEGKLGSSGVSNISVSTEMPNRTLINSNVPVAVSINVSKSQTVSSTDTNTISLNGTSTIPSEDQDIDRSDLINASVLSHHNASIVHSVGNSSFRNASDISNNSSEASHTASSSKKTLSSVTDLLFTVPNERVINPAEDSEVKSEIKSTEKLIRTSLEDLLFRAPGGGSKQISGSESEEGAQQNISEAALQLHEIATSPGVKQAAIVDGHSKNDSLVHKDHPVQGSPPETGGSREKPDSGVVTAEQVTENGSSQPMSIDKENEELWTDSSIQQNDLILRTACLPVGSIGRFKVQDVTYLVTGLGAGTDGEDCWREVTNVVKTHIKLPPMNHTTLLATTAFYFVAASANLIEPDMAYGFVRVEQFRIAANIMCQRAADQLPDPLACLDYQYIAALLSHGLQLPDHTEILVCEKIRGFRLGWALGAALNYLQKH